MSKPVEIKVGHNTFYVQKLGAFEALKTFAALQKDILPAIGGLIGGGDIGETIAALSERLNEKQVDYWTKRLLCDGNVSFEKGNDAVQLKAAFFDEVFAEDFTELLELTVRVAMENFQAPLMRWLNQSGLGSSIKNKVADVSKEA